MGLDRRKTDSAEHLNHALELAALEAAAKAARITARDVARKAARRAAVAYLLLFSFLLAGAVAWQSVTNSRLRHAASVAAAASERLDRSEMRACERLQAQRERINVSEARQYLLLRAIATSPRASAKVADRYDALSRTTLYDPPTDCEAAVRHPNTYRRPASTSFSRPPGERTSRRSCRRRRRSARSPSRTRRRTLVPHRLVTVGYLGVVVGGAFALNHASKQRSEQKLRSLENACLAIGNPGRALGTGSRPRGVPRVLQSGSADPGLPRDLLRATRGSPSRSAEPAAALCGVGAPREPARDPARTGPSRRVSRRAAGA
jgi:hypothetical protein